jgi:hypothetical protein
MKRPPLLYAGFAIVTLAVLVAPAVAWAQAPAAAPAGTAPAGRQADNNTTAPPPSVAFLPHESKRTVLPGGNATHLFVLKNVDGKHHVLEINSTAFGKGWSYVVSPTSVELRGNESAKLAVLVKAPLIPGDLGHLVLLRAVEKGTILDKAQAKTTILLPP